MPAVTSGDPLNLVEAWGAGSSVIFEDCELRVPTANRSWRTSGGIHGSNVTFRRSRAVGFVDAFCPAGVNQKGSWLAEDFEIAETMHYVDAAIPQSDGQTHDDSVDVYGNLSSLILRRGTIANAHGSGVFVKASRLAGGITEFVLEDLRFPITNRPSPYGISVQFAPEDPVLSNVTIKRLAFSTQNVSSIPRMLLDQEQLNATNIVATGPDACVWLDDGTPPSTIVPVWRGAGSSPAMYTDYGTPPPSFAATGSVPIGLPAVSVSATFTEPATTTVTVSSVETGATTTSSTTQLWDVSDATASVRTVILEKNGVPLGTRIYGATATGSTIAKKSTVTGLDPDSDYVYGVEANGVLLSSPRGTFRTAPTGVWSGDILFGSCAGNTSSAYIVNAISDAPTFEAMKNIGADLFLHLGDFHYQYPGNVSVATHLDIFKQVRSTPRQAALYQSLSMMRHSDDGELTDNWHSTTSGRTNHYNALDQGSAHYSWPVASTWATTFTWGSRIRIMSLDIRMQQVSGGTLLGTAQKTWIQNTLGSATERLVILEVGIPWIGTATNTWGGWAADRQVVAEAITAYQARTGGKVIIIAGDMHGLAMDAGTNSQYDPANTGPGPFVFQAAPFDASSSTKGGPYSIGTYTGSRHQFGRLNIADNGTTITVTATGYSVSTTSPFPITSRLTHTVTI